MTYAASAVAYWVGKYNTSQTDLANQTAATVAEHNLRYVNGAGTGQLWSENAAYWQAQYNAELALYNDMVAQRNAWQANANTAYDSGTWGAGTHWHTRYDTLHNGLTNPDSSPNYVTAAASIGITDGGIVTLTLPKTGHWLVSATCTVNGSWHSQGGDPQVTFTGSGGFSGSVQTSGTNSGSVLAMQGGAGFVAHGAYNAGQTFTISSSSWRFDSGSRSATIYAHYVPSTAYDS